MAGLDESLTHRLVVRHGDARDEISNLEPGGRQGLAVREQQGRLIPDSEQSVLKRREQMTKRTLHDSRDKGGLLNAPDRQARLSEMHRQSSRKEISHSTRDIWKAFGPLAGRKTIHAIAGSVDVHAVALIEPPAR